MTRSLVCVVMASYSAVGSSYSSGLKKWSWCNFNDIFTAGATTLCRRSISAKTHSSRGDVMRKSPLNSAWSPCKKNSTPDSELCVCVAVASVRRANSPSASSNEISDDLRFISSSSSDCLPVDPSSSARRPFAVGGTRVDGWGLVGGVDPFFGCDAGGCCSGAVGGFDFWLCCRLA